MGGQDPFETRTLSRSELGLGEARKRRGEHPGSRPFSLAGVLAPAPRVAIVGSRAVLRRNGDSIACIVEQAAARGLSVVSGGARGADARAHGAALAAQCPQIAVLPTGPDRVYPPEHRELFARISEAPYSGLLFAASRGTPLCRGMFASRNRWVVALSAGVIVVQAALRSGSFGTGKLALAKGRPCAAFLSSEGGQALVGAGAHSLGFAGESGWQARTEHFLDRLTGAEAQLHAPGPAWPPHLLWLRAALAHAPSCEPHKGVTLEQLGQPLRALCALTEATTLGLVVEPSPGRYRAAQA